MEKKKLLKELGKRFRALSPEQQDKLKRKAQIYQETRKKHMAGLQAQYDATVKHINYHNIEITKITAERERLFLLLNPIKEVHSKTQENRNSKMGLMKITTTEKTTLGNHLGWNVVINGYVYISFVLMEEEAIRYALEKHAEAGRD